MRRALQIRSPMASKTILGIDPGLSGGFALLWYGEHERTIMDAWNTPTFTVLRNKKNRRELDIPKIKAIFSDARIGSAVIESQQAMPKQGVSTTFTTGKNYGILIGVLATLAIPYHIVAPQTWKRALGITKDKETSFALARKLFPHDGDFWKRKKDDGVAEAALLAHYGERL